MDKKRLIQLLREFAPIYGEEISQALFQNLTFVTEQEIVQLCGSWAKLRAAAGLVPFPGRARRGERTAEDVLEALRLMVQKHGPRVTLQTFVKETGINPQIIDSRCGGWRQARESLGLPGRANAAGCHSSPERIGGRITREQMLEDMRKAVKKYGENITFLQFCRETGCHWEIICKRFGKWSELRVAAGLAPYGKPAPRFTREDLLEDLLQVYRRTGREPTMNKHRRNGGQICAKTIREYFGSWENAMKAFEKYRRELGE